MLYLDRLRSRPNGLAVHHVYCQRVPGASRETIVHISIVVLLAVILFILVRRGLVNVDLSFPWFLSLLLFGLLSTSESFVERTASLLGIAYSPIATVLVTIFIVLGLVTALLITVTRLRHRQILMVREIARLDLMLQEVRLRPQPEMRRD